MRHHDGPSHTISEPHGVSNGFALKRHHRANRRSHISVHPGAAENKRPRPIGKPNPRRRRAILTSGRKILPSPRGAPCRATQIHARPRTSPSRAEFGRLTPTDRHHLGHAHFAFENGFPPPGDHPPPPGAAPSKNSLKQNDSTGVIGNWLRSSKSEFRAQHAQNSTTLHNHQPPTTAHQPRRATARPALQYYMARTPGQHSTMNNDE